MIIISNAMCFSQAAAAAASPSLPPLPVSYRLAASHMCTSNPYKRSKAPKEIDVEMICCSQAAAAAAAPPPPGLSPADVALLQEKGVPSQDVLQRQKLGLLHLLAAAADKNTKQTPTAASGGGGGGSTATTTTAAAGGGGGGGDAMEIDETKGKVQEKEQEEEGGRVGVGGNAGAVAAAGGGDGDGGGGGAVFSPEELLLPLLVASCDPFEAVAR